MRKGRLGPHRVRPTGLARNGIQAVGGEKHRERIRKERISRRGAVDFSEHPLDDGPGLCDAFPVLFLFEGFSDRPAKGRRRMAVQKRKKQIPIFVRGLRRECPVGERRLQPPRQKAFKKSYTVLFALPHALPLSMKQRCSVTGGGTGRQRSEPSGEIRKNQEERTAAPNRSGHNRSPFSRDQPFGRARNVQQCGTRFGRGRSCVPSAIRFHRPRAGFWRNT